MLAGHVTVGQSQEIGCLWKPGFVNFGHILCCSLAQVFIDSTLNFIIDHEK